MTATHTIEKTTRSGAQCNQKPVEGRNLDAATLKRLKETLENDFLVEGEGGMQMAARSIYTDPALFELELRYLFEGGWIYAAHTSQIPKTNDYFTTYAGRQPIVLTRDDRGEIRGFLNVCAHRGARVCRQRKGNSAVHTCGFHGWSYNVRGELINVTDQERGAYPQGFDRTKLGLIPVARVEEYRGFIWISLNPDVPPLKEYLGGARLFIDLLVDQSPTGEMEVLRGETSFTYRGNWKLTAENGLDGYHGMAVHGNYIMTVSRRAKGVSSNTTETVAIDKVIASGMKDSGFFAFDNGHAVIYAPYPNFTSRPNYEQLDNFVARFGQERADWMTKRIRNFLLMPNVYLMDQMSSQIRTFRPVSVDLTEVTNYCIAPVGESDGARERRIRQYEDFFNASGMATPDDVTEFKNCQLGYQAARAPWNDLSRGKSRWINGVNEVGKSLGVNARMSSNDMADEGIYVNLLQEWAKKMKAAIDKELAMVEA